MSWGRSLMGKQKDCKNCWGSFGCIDKNRLLSFLIVCKNCRRAAAMLTWGLPALGCAPPFSLALVAAAALFSLLLLLFSLSSSLSPLSLFFCWQGELCFHLAQRKQVKKKALFCGNTLAIYFLCIKSYLVHAPRRTSSLRCAPPQPPQLTPIVCFACGRVCSPCTYTKHMPVPALKNVNNKFPLAFTAISSFH